MPRKRRQVKPTTIEEENEENVEPPAATTHDTSKQQHGPMYTIMSNAQLNETFHKKYIKEMQDLYMKMDHDAFMFTFIKMLKCAMATEETNEFAHTTLIFCAKYIASYDEEDTHPVLLATFKWLLSTISSNPHIRYRICQYVNIVLSALGLEAALDDTICDSILGYMINRLKDLNPNVRVQAILALQRLQIPDNPDDVVVKTYQFHLSSDPSPRVRQAVITSMGRNYNTIPYILERLWDVDEKVRRHTYLHMSSYPVKAYKVAQRLTFLEQGLNDRSDMVRKVVTTVMLPQWLESYNKNIIALVSAFKLDANEAEIDRFRKITKIALLEIFKRQKKEFLVATLPLEEEGECEKCIPFDKLSVDITLYWLCLIEYLQNENADELDSIIPELTTFCNYVQKYCESSGAGSDMDKWQKMEYQYTLLTLMEIVNTFDLGDEIGRENLKILLEYLLKNFEIEEHTIKVIIQCAEKLITKQEDRLQYFVDIVKDISDCKSLTNEISNDRTLVEKLLENHPDKEDLKFKISSMKVKILDLEEQEMNFVKKKEYVQAQRISEELDQLRGEYRELLLPFLNQSSDVSSDASKKITSLTFQQRKMSPEVLIKALQISFYMVVSKNVKSLTLNVCDLYRDFIRRHVESNQIAVRDWALKCGTAYSMLYEPLSKDVYSTLYSQFYKNHNVRLWKTAVECIFELLDRYSCSHFDIEDKHNKSRKAGRQLYNTQNSTLDSIDADDEPNTSNAYGVDLIFMMSHFLDTCDDVCILSALVNGFCRLVLHGQMKNEDIMEKMLLMYFNPVTDAEINQILGVFFENLIKRKKQEYLQPCLLPTISTIMRAPYDSPLREIKPENVLRFVIDSTRPIHNINIHDSLALSFLQEMQNNISNKELLKLLVKELITMNISNADESSSREEMRTLIEKLLQCDIDPKTAKYLGNFRDILDGMYQPSTLSVRTTIRGEGSDEDNDEGSDDEDENRNIIEETNENDANQPPNANENGLETVTEEPNENNDANEENNEPANEVSMQSLQTSQSQETNENNEAPQPAEEVLQSSEETLQPAEEEFLQPPEEFLQPSEEEVLQPPEEAPQKEPEENPVPPPPQQQTPTTFGKDNTTRLRYLRKSLNVPQTTLDEPPTKRLRLRNNAKGTTETPTKPNTKKSTKTITANKKQQFQAEAVVENSTDERTNSDSSDKETTNASKTSPSKNKQSPRKDSSPAVERRKSLLPAESSDELEPLVVSEDEVIYTDDEVEVVTSSDDEEVVSSPTVNETTTTATRSRRLAKRPSPTSQKVSRSTRSNKNQLETTATNKSVTKNVSTPPNKTMSPAGTENNNGQQKRRRQRLFVSPQMEKGDNELFSSPLRKQSRNNLEISDHAEKNALNRRNESATKQKSSNNEKTKSTTADLTKSVERRIRTGKNPVLKLSRSETANRNAHKTRSASKQELLLNTIVTRRKVTAENSPKRPTLQKPNSSRPVINHNKENIIEKGNSKATGEKSNINSKTPQKSDSTTATRQKSRTVEKSKKTAVESTASSTKQSSKIDVQKTSRSRTMTVTQVKSTRRSVSTPGTRLRSRK